MITTIEQATKVQQIRVAKGKQGHSKAVRAFCKRNLNLADVKEYEAYQMLKNNLPHLEIKPKAKETKTSTEKSTNTVISGANVINFMENTNGHNN